MSKEKIEINIFKEFSKHHPLEFNLTTVRKATPPHPDIEVECMDNTKRYFELSEIVDQDMIRRLNSSVTIRKACDKHYQNLRSEDKRTFTEKFGHSFIHITFHDRISLHKQRNVIPHFFKYLMELKKIEKVNIPEKGDLSKSVRRIYIQTKGNPDRPYFSVSAVGGIGDPIIDRMNDKINKKYNDNYPIELVLYYSLQPERIGEYIFDEACEFAQENIVNSCFQRIWIYSTHQDMVLKEFSKPNPIS